MTITQYTTTFPGQKLDTCNVKSGGIYCNRWTQETDVVWLLEYESRLFIPFDGIKSDWNMARSFVHFVV